MSDRYDSLFTTETKGYHSCFLIFIIIIIIVYAIYSLLSGGFTS